MSASLRILDETRISIVEAQQRLGTESNPIHFASVYRYMARGIKAASGERVTLEFARVGGKLITSAEAIQRFVGRLSGIDPECSEAGPARSKLRQRELGRVDAELNAAGI
jgi:hypothetical protein